MLNKKLQTAQKSLLLWYSTDARSELPWRKTSNIYHIYLSEIMLQQTQVSRVEATYYPQFLKRFPTLKSLAASSLEDVFSMWSGLGYYRRAKNLHATAQLVGSALPKTKEELLQLPGIGKYTASAICSFGYKQIVSVVDTNIARVLARFFAKVDAKEKELWSLADAFLNIKSPTAHNLALMDLGAMVCLPKNPTCKVCPLHVECLGKDEADKYYKKKNIVYENKTLHYGIHVKNGSLAMQKSTKGMYKGMLELLCVENPHVDDLIGGFKHSVTRFRLDVKVYRLKNITKNVHWIALDSLENAPISSLTQKALRVYEGKLA
ncbi:A/G-specific adenine glycosylase [Sulfurimonas sp. SAG-AH-194-I05]|nr:A/G-specific adenine glycosylase [Sulfurimonas sp. SAG-AH-194-I05]MDF1875884.1 A/G-specific adenine glycosylase [Sulfurimonas sp. SAG-AH-194-I05]